MNPIDFWTPSMSPAIVGAVTGSVITSVLAYFAWVFRDRLNLKRQTMDRTLRDIEMTRTSAKDRDDALRSKLNDIDDNVGTMSEEMQSVVTLVQENAQRHERAERERKMLDEKIDRRIDKLRDQSVRVRELNNLREHMTTQFNMLRSWMQKNVLDEDEKKS